MLKVERLPTVRLNVPQWFERLDFMAWLNNPLNTIATWHRGTEANDYSDVFMTYDHGEGSDLGSNDFPEDIEKELIATMDAQGVEYGIIWLSNVE